MLEDVVHVSLDSIVGEVAKTKLDGYRFVTLSCTALDRDRFDILYHFDKELRLKHLRLTVPRDLQVPSISAVYFAAFLVENEIQDLFGLRFKGLAIDYKRTLYLDAEAAAGPFCNNGPGGEAPSEDLQPTLRQENA